MSMEIDSNNDSITTTTPTKTQTSKNVSGKERSPGKRKKDYVFKFWLALYQRCEPILNEFKSKNSNEKSNKKGDEMKMDTDDDNNTSNTNEDKKENREHSNLSSDEDIAMREASIESGNNANGSNVGLTFEKLDAFMGNKQLIALVGKFWAVLQAYIKNESIRKESIKDARIILSTLMISMFPNDVLDVADIKDMDALSEACYNAAQNVLSQVFGKDPNTFGSRIASLESSEENSESMNAATKIDNNTNQTKFDCEQAFKAINNFFGAFKNWQTQDKTKILESVLNFYEQWRRSYAVLQVSSMNEAQREGILKVMSKNIENCKKKIKSLVDNNESKMTELCANIDAKLEREAAEAAAAKAKETEASSQTSANNEVSTNTSNNDVTMASASNTNTNNTNSNGNKSVGPSVEEQLRARGVPVNMKTGKNLVGNGKNENWDEKQSKDNEANDDSKYMTTDENGNKVLNLDAIIMEEASKNYWLDFEKEIEKENWSRLFELLSELLERIKKLSPKKDHKMLDDIIDVSFIQQTITHGLIDASGFYGIFHGIWKQLRSLHAPARDSAWDAWHDKILKDMSATNATWAKLLSQVFNTFLLKVDEIEDQIAVIQSIREKKKSESK